MAKVSEKNLMKYEMAMNYAIARILQGPGEVHENWHGRRERD